MRGVNGGRGREYWIIYAPPAPAARRCREIRNSFAHEVAGGMLSSSPPLALDESWKTCHWPARLREQIMEYNVLDFSDWNDEGTFRRMFARLLDGLHLFYKS